MSHRADRHANDHDGRDDRDRHGKRAETRADAHPDVMHGRSLAGAEYGANEDEQTAERNRAGRASADEAGESMITDAELEERQDDAGRER